MTTAARVDMDSCAATHIMGCNGLEPEQTNPNLP